MGGRGNAATRNSSSSTSPQERFVGKRVSEFTGIKSSEIEEKLGLTKLTESQKNTLMYMLRGAAEHDYSYDEDHTPYTISQFSIRKIGEEFNKSGTGDIQVLMSTHGDTGRPGVDWMDTRTRLFIIGKKGGAYTYDKNRKRRNIKDFNVRYGFIHSEYEKIYG